MDKHREHALVTHRKERMVAKVSRILSNLGLPQLFFKVKGPDADLIPELEKFRGGGHVVDERMEESYKVLTEHLDRHIGKVDQRLTTIEALRMKEKTSSPGEPWSVLYPTFGDIIKTHMRDNSSSEEEAYSDCAKFVDMVEEGILSGEFDSQSLCPSFYIHSKEDRYKPSKIFQRQYRSIQSCDWVLQTICHKNCGVWSASFKNVVPEIAVTASCDTWHSKIGYPLSGGFTYATDITGFDRGVTDTLIYYFVAYLKRVCSLPDLMAKFLFEALAYGMLVMPDGRVMEKPGGNASGQPWTTELNCFVHLWMCIDVYSFVLGIDPVDVLRRIVIRVVGDDEALKALLADIQRIASQSPQVFMERWGYIVKAETWLDGDGVEQTVFPPGCHAPFLDCTSVLVSGRYVDAPLRVLRRMTSLMYPPKKGVHYREVVRGVFEAVKGWSLLAKLKREYPPQLDTLFGLVSEHNVGLSDSDVAASYAIEI